MPPDLNSLPPSPNPAGHHSPSSHSLAAAAALNAGLHNESSRRSSNSSARDRDARIERRRRSSIRMSLSLNDPSIPGPGEFQLSPRLSRPGSSALPNSPSHQRNPSLGELHQEWESEQELQVNRLLTMIRSQQATIHALQNQSASASVAVEDPAPASERPVPVSSLTLPQPPVLNAVSVPRRTVSQSLSRNSSFRSGRSSHNGSPATAALGGHGSPVYEGGDFSLGSSLGRDESAFYQAETQNLTRENQMLKHRIRELERQLSDMGSPQPIPHSPHMSSNLQRPPISSSDTLPTATETPDIARRMQEATND